MGLTSGKLLRGTKYPESVQALLELFASYLGLPSGEKIAFFVQSDPSGIPTDGSALWLDLSTNSLRTYLGGKWIAATAPFSGIENNKIGHKSLYAENFTPNIVFDTTKVSTQVLQYFTTLHEGTVKEVNFKGSNELSQEQHILQLPVQTNPSGGKFTSDVEVALEGSTKVKPYYVFQNLPEGITCVQDLYGYDQYGQIDYSIVKSRLRVTGDVVPGTYYVIYNNTTTRDSHYNPFYYNNFNNKNVAGWYFKLVIEDWNRRGYYPERNQIPRNAFPFNGAILPYSGLQKVASRGVYETHVIVNIPSGHYDPSNPLTYYQGTQYYEGNLPDNPNTLWRSLSGDNSIITIRALYNEVTLYGEGLPFVSGGSGGLARPADGYFNEQNDPDGEDWASCAIDGPKLAPSCVTTDNIQDGSLDLFGFVAVPTYGYIKRTIQVGEGEDGTPIGGEEMFRDYYYKSLGGAFSGSTWILNQTPGSHDYASDGTGVNGVTYFSMMNDQWIANGGQLHDNGALSYSVDPFVTVTGFGFDYLGLNGNYSRAYDADPFTPWVKDDVAFVAVGTSNWKLMNTLTGVIYYTSIGICLGQNSFDYTTGYGDSRPGKELGYHCPVNFKWDIPQLVGHTTEQTKFVYKSGIPITTIPIDKFMPNSIDGINIGGILDIGQLTSEVQNLIMPEGALYLAPKVNLKNPFIKYDRFSQSYLDSATKLVVAHRGELVSLPA